MRFDEFPHGGVLDPRHPDAAILTPLDDLFYDTVRDMYYAERDILRTLPKLQKAAVPDAVAATIGFDFFLTIPYFQLRIDSFQDFLLAGLLLLVGLAVSELASWGIRQSASAT